MPEINEYQLSPEEIAELDTYRKAIADLNLQINAALRLLARQQGLQGAWKIDGNKLVKEN